MLRGLFEGPGIFVVLAVVLLLFGATRLPALARSIGQSTKIFRDEMKTGKGEADAAAPDAAADAAAPMLVAEPVAPAATTAEPAAPTKPAKSPKAPAGKSGKTAKS
jgi:sec-independent protein translocase protein TatA